MPSMAVAENADENEDDKADVKVDYDEMAPCKVNAAQAIEQDPTRGFRCGSNCNVTTQMKNTRVHRLTKY